MKKIFFFYFILVSCFQFLVSSALAINPVIIKKAKPGAPPGNNPLSRDQDFYPNSVGLTCKGTYTISQTFQPKEEITKDKKTGEETKTFIPYNVDKIEGSSPFFSKGFWTNPSALNFYRHIGNPVKAIFGDVAASKRAFLSYDPDSDVGSIGSGNKTLPYSILKCLVGQRLVQAVRNANGAIGIPYTNEQIAWDNGGSYTSAVGSSQDKGKKVQLDDIAISMDQNPYLSLVDTDASGMPTVDTKPNYAFYDPDADCLTNDPKLIPTPGPLSQFAPTSSKSYDPIPPQAAVVLYKILSYLDSGPSMRKVKTCSDYYGQEIDCETKKTIMPRGGVFATFPYLANMIMPFIRDVPEKDLCAVNEKQEIRDKPNPVNFFKAAWDAFGEVRETAKTFSHPLKYTYKLASEQTDGISYDDAALEYYIPLPGIKDSCISDKSQGSSSTDGKSFDPGNPCVRNEFYTWTNPLPWQQL